MVRWQAVGPELLDWASWGDDEHVLYHRESGQTHLVNRAAVVLLTDVLREPRDLDQVIESLSAGWPPEQRERNIEETVGLVFRLEELGLVRAL